MIKIQIIEDDVEMNNALKIYFEKAGYVVLQCFNVKEAYKMMQMQQADIIIVDIGLPDGSGLEIAGKIKNSNDVPVVFLTARDEENDILKGYESGCEEYITKPVSPKILQKKIEAILKRSKTIGNVMIYKELEIDYEKRKIWKNGIEIKLTSKEWKILSLMSKNRGKIMTQESLLDKIWDSEGNFVDKHTVTVVISRLRKKIETSTEEPVYIKNIFGIGYTFGE